jgi:predicted membrane protein
MKIKKMENNYTKRGDARQRGKSWLVGIPFLLVGAVLLLDQIGFYFPDWLFQWEMIVILVGIVIGLKDGFKNFTWMIVVGVGVFFLADDFIPNLRLGRFIMPLIFVGIGLSIISSNRRRKAGNPEPVPPVDYNDYGVRTETDPSFTENDTKSSANSNEPIADENSKYVENILDIASIFGNVKKYVMTKNFRGGEIVTVFGGADINLMHADFNKVVEVEAVNIFGGTKLIIPASWEIRSEVVSIFGGIEDKRQFSSIPVIPEKTLVLKGFCMFGGIEIKSFYR